MWKCSAASSCRSSTSAPPTDLILRWRSHPALHLLMSCWYWSAVLVSIPIPVSQTHVLLVKMELFCPHLELNKVRPQEWTQQSEHLPRSFDSYESSTLQMESVRGSLLLLLVEQSDCMWQMFSCRKELPWTCRRTPAGVLLHVCTVTSLKDKSSIGPDVELGTSEDWWRRFCLDYEPENKLNLQSSNLNMYLTLSVVFNMSPTVTCQTNTCRMSRGCDSSVSCVEVCTCSGWHVQVQINNHTDAF